jgi:hypothetical protein
MAALLLTGAACQGADDIAAPAASAEATALAAYFSDHPDAPHQHHLWHQSMAVDAPDYGSKFLAFHRDYIQAFDDWRAQHGLAALLPWDPATPIPTALAHPGRLTSDPSAIDPLCRLPPWLTRDGGAQQERDPEFGAANLGEFTSANQLGLAIDSQTGRSWHRRVHTTIGGDMGGFLRNPYDPVFWRFHRFVDDVWKAYDQAQAPAPASGGAP